MAAQLIKDNPGGDFLLNLMGSEMIEVRYFNDEERKDMTLRVPAVLACGISKRFEDLCAWKHTLTSEELLGMRQAEFDGNACHNGFHQVIMVFVGWLYTSSFEHCTEFTDYGDLWALGHYLGAPAFQNAVLNALCDGADHNDQAALSHLQNHMTANSLMWCPLQADFSQNNMEGYNLAEDEVYFADNKYLKFLLDSIVYLGFTDAHTQSELREIVADSPTMVMPLMRLMDEAARSGGYGGAPWARDNIVKYFVTSNASGRAVGNGNNAQAQMLAPAVARAPSPQADFVKKEFHDTIDEDTIVIKDEDDEDEIQLSSPFSWRETEEQVSGTSRDLIFTWR